MALPLSVVYPENDNKITGKKIEVLKTRLEKESQVDCEVKVYEGVTHGTSYLLASLLSFD